MTYTPIDFGEKITENDVIDNLEESVVDAYEDALDKDIISSDVRNMLHKQLNTIRSNFVDLREASR